MGLFSSPPALRDEVKAAISPFLFADNVHQKTQADGQLRVAKSQEALLGALKPGEEILVIVPCYAGNTGYAGLVISTTERLLEISGKHVYKEMARSSLADVKRMASPHGSFLLALISEKAAPVSDFAQSDPRNNRSARVYWEGTIQVPILTQQMMNHFVQSTGYSG